MEINIDSESVVICLIGITELSLNWNQLAEMEKAIEIIRKLQESAHVDSATIKIT